MQLSGVEVLIGTNGFEATRRTKGGNLPYLEVPYRQSQLLESTPSLFRP